MVNGIGAGERRAGTNLKGAAIFRHTHPLFVYSQLMRWIYPSHSHHSLPFIRPLLVSILQRRYSPFMSRFNQASRKNREVCGLWCKGEDIE